MSRKQDSLPMSNYDWEAEQDVRALARAKAVQSDPDRFAKAKAYAKKMLKESKDRHCRAKSEVEETALMVEMGEK